MERSGGHSLDSDDIHADIIRNRRTEIIAGYDPRFDKHIYETYKHGELVRIFAPIVSEDRVLGTLEAGYQRSHRDIITDEKREAFEGLIASYAPKMRLATLDHVFETIVRARCVWFRPTLVPSTCSTNPTSNVMPMRQPRETLAKNGWRLFRRARKGSDRER